MITVSTESLRPADRLVAVFEGVKQGLGGVRREFRRSLIHLDCAALHVCDTGQRWYQYEEPAILDLIDQVKAAARQVGASKLICLGNSMGGFGALYLGARLEADLIMGFAPQTAIDPEVTRELGDHRWERYQAHIPAYPFGDLSREPPASGRVILCWGDQEPLDQAHADRLARTWRFEQITVPGASHNAAYRLKETGELVPLLERAILD